MEKEGLKETPKSQIVEEINKMIKNLEQMVLKEGKIEKGGVHILPYKLRVVERIEKELGVDVNKPILVEEYSSTYSVPISKKNLDNIIRCTRIKKEVFSTNRDNVFLEREWIIEDKTGEGKELRSGIVTLRSEIVMVYNDSNVEELKEKIEKLKKV